MNSTKSYKIIDLFFKKLSSKDTPYFFKGKLVNPLKIIAISADFSKLKIKDEDLLLLYSSKKDSNDFDFVITSKHIHTKNNMYLLEITALKNELIRLTSQKRKVVTVDGKPDARKVTVMGDKKIPFALLKKIMLTCTKANYTNISLAVLRKRDKG